MKITVHMGTCGIAAGAREVMNTLMEEMNQSDRRDIQVESGGCMGKCPTEPNVTVKVGWEEPVVYQKMNAEKTRQVFENHVLGGEVQTDFVMGQFVASGPLSVARYLFASGPLPVVRCNRD